VADISLLERVRLPLELLIALDCRPFHVALQPVHHLVRMAHVVSTAAFFGAIAVVDLRLIGFWSGLSLRSLERLAHRWLYGGLGVALVTGLALFLYAPVQVGSHLYFVPKLLLILIGLAHAAIFHLTVWPQVRERPADALARARLAGLASLTIWFGIFACAALNVESAPRVALW
jgi:hypothetical protein